MKIRPMKWQRIAELFFGVVMPVVFVVPLVFVYLVFGYGALLWAELTSPLLGWHYTFKVFLGFSVGTVSIAAVAALAILILFGIDELKKRQKLIWFVRICAVFGFGIGLVFFVNSLNGWITFFSNMEGVIALLSWDLLTELRTWKFIFYEDARSISLGLIGPLGVGARYLPGLLRGIV